MRAATRAGLTFVGSQAGQVPAKDKFTPRVIAPDRAYLAMREALAKALTDKDAFGKEELARWTQEFGEVAVEKIGNLTRKE